MVQASPVSSCIRSSRFVAYKRGTKRGKEREREREGRKKRKSFHFVCFDSSVPQMEIAKEKIVRSNYLSCHIECTLFLSGDLVLFHGIRIRY